MQELSKLTTLFCTFCKNIGKIQDNNTINIKNRYLKIGLFASLLENMYNKTIAIMII